MGLATLLRQRARPGKELQSIPAVPQGNTRTAQRKRRKLEAAARAARAAQPPEADDEEGSDVEGGTAVVEDQQGAYRTLVRLVAPLEADEDASDAEFESEEGEEAVEDLSEPSEDGEPESEDGSLQDEEGVDGDGRDEEEEEEEEEEGIVDVEEVADARDASSLESTSSDEDELDEEVQAVLVNGSVSGSANGHSTVPTADRTQLHLERKLTEAECSALLAGTRALHPAAEAAQAALQVAWPGVQLLASEDLDLPSFPPATDLASYGIKERLASRWRTVQGTEPGAELASGRQASLFALLSTRADLMHSARPYPTTLDPAEPDAETDALLLHALQHCASSADRIKKNNERLKADPGLDPPRDQGFTRPTVLLLLPLRSLALRAVTRMAQLAVVETRTDSVQNKPRFLEEFGVEDEEEAGRAAARKPLEHRALFSGNTDDHFRLGVKLTRGAVKLYSDFMQSDIIVASPLALATKLTDPGDREGADFLSSIELVIMDRADVVLMQNWEHALTVFDALNAAPKTPNPKTDIMRVREWYLSGHARCYRQTILTSSFLAPEMAALLRRGGACHAGAARLEMAAGPGVLPRVLAQLRQVYERLPRGAPAEEPGLRFQRFCDSIWPRIKDSSRGGGQLIYIPSYFDFVRIRNFLRSEDASLLLLSEYTDSRDAGRARAYFTQGRRKILLYTERAQFYNRSKIGGIQDIWFYQLPSHAQFYEELLNQVQESAAGGLPTVTVLFSMLDALRLERIVGKARASRMLRPTASSTFLFC